MDMDGSFIYSTLSNAYRKMDLLGNLWKASQQTIFPSKSMVINCIIIWAIVLTIL